jgi:hypothetical protein
MMEKLRFETKAMKQRGYTSNGSSVGDLNSPGLLPESLTSLSPMSVEDGKPGVMKVGRATRKPEVNKEEEELLEIVATLTERLASRRQPAFGIRDTDYLCFALAKGNSQHRQNGRFGRMPA